MHSAMLPICVYSAVLTPFASGTMPLFTADAEALTLDQIVPKGGGGEAKHLADHLSADPGVGEVETAEISRRPNQGGKIDVITFGIALLQMYGLKLAENTFVADVRLTFQWYDERVRKVDTRLLRTGRVRYLTLSEGAAQKKIWMPGMVVTNQAMVPSKTIASTVKIDSTGLVTLIRRQLVSIKSKFDITKYPYDNQTLRITVASSRYMADAVKLVDLGTSKVFDNACKGSSMNLMSNKTSVFEDGVEEGGWDGFSKSRGILQFEVQRDPDVWNQGRRTAYLLTACGYAMFWTPMDTRFEIRIELLIVSLLSLLQVRTAYLSELNGCTETSLGEVLYSSCMLALFCGLFFNITIEYVWYELKRRSLAEALHFEVRFTYPIVFLVNMIQCFYVHLSGWESSILVCILFICRCYVGVQLDRATDDETTAASATTDTGANESKSSKP